MPKSDPTITLDQSPPIYAGDTVTFTVTDAPPNAVVNLIAYPWRSWAVVVDVGEPVKLAFDGAASVSAYLFRGRERIASTYFEVDA